MKSPRSHALPSPASNASSLNSFNLSRRSFIRKCSMAAAATGLPVWFLERELAAAETTVARPSPNDRPGVALIGSGSQGTGDTVNASRYGEVLAVCDVDSTHVARAVEKFTVEGKAPTGYSDFRRLLARKDIHVVVNATPDHWHTLINIAAAKAGKDVYAEKPLTLTIDEGRQVIRAVRENKTVLQTGTQQRSSQRFRLACELVRNGRIGKLKEATVWLPAGLRGGPFAKATIPTGLNWDFWQGQTPRTDYVVERCHRTFRFWYEYSGGTMTDWGAHHNDIAYWAIGLLAPDRVEARRLKEPVAGGYNAYSDYEVDYTYANGVALKIRTTPDDDIYGAVVNKDGQRNGIRFEGTDGWIWVNRSRTTPCGSTKAPITWAIFSTAYARGSFRSAMWKLATAPRRCAISERSRCAPATRSTGMRRRNVSRATTPPRPTPIRNAKCARPTTTVSGRREIYSGSGRPFVSGRKGSTIRPIR